MDRFVKNFIAISIFYLAAASVLGVIMGIEPEMAGKLKFAHSHLMLIGWVTMMIYGVGYHILPRFAGQLIKYKGMAEVQFWAANAGLVGMVTFYSIISNKALFAAFAGLEVVSVLMFFYNMIATLYAREAAH